MCRQLNSPFVEAFSFFFPTVFSCHTGFTDLADDNMNNSSNVLQVWVKALQVNHKSSWRKTNKLLRERDGERSNAHAAPGKITSPPHRRFTQLDEGCGPIIRYWWKHPCLQRWWREFLVRRQKGSVWWKASKCVWRSYKMRLMWNQNFFLGAIFFQKCHSLDEAVMLKVHWPVLSGTTITSTSNCSFQEASAQV